MQEYGEIRVGVIGLGGMGGRHAAILAQRVKGARVSVVFEPDATRLAALLPVLDAVAAESADTLIDDPAVDAVVIAAPDATHAPLVLACLNAGKPVLCEKPLAENAEDARQIVAREVELGRRLVQVGFMRRFDPAHLALKHAVEAGRLGAPQFMRGWHRNQAARPGVVSERVVTGSLIHDLDSTRWLMGEEIVRVHVVGQRCAESVAEGQHDLLLVECRLASGRHALLEVFVNAGYGYEVGVEIVGSSGIACTPPEANPLLRLEGQAGSAIAPDWLVRFDTAYARQMAVWAEGLRAHTPVTGADAWDGFASLVCADACIGALRRGNDVDVALPPKPDLYANL